jgi:hypothetical protein
VLGIAISMLLVAAAFALEVAPDPGAWLPYPEAGARWVWVTAVGGVSFDGAFRDVTHVDPDGWVRIEERRADATRWMVATPVAGTERPAGAAAGAFPGVRIDYVVDGRATPWEDAGRAWLAELLTADPARIEWLRERERDGSGTSGANLRTSDDVWVSLVHVAPSMRATFGTGHLGWTLFGLGGPHPIDPQRPRLDTGSIDVATEVQAALFMAHHLAAHDLVAPNDLETFLQALAAQLRALDDVERIPVGP